MSTLSGFYSILWCTEPLLLYSESIRVSAHFVTSHFVHACISKLKGHTTLKIAHMVWECSINLFSKSLTYRSAPKQNALFANQFLAILIYSGKCVNWTYDFQSIRRWILCPLMPDEKLSWMKWKSSSASRSTD